MPRDRHVPVCLVDESELVQALERASTGSLLVVTGAGVSLASGLPTFRGVDEGAIWSRDVLERGTLRFFLEHPEESWAWYLDRFASVEHAAPNAAHDALVALEARQRQAGGEMLLVTQNIDGLHRAAGSRDVVEVHGRADRVRCIAPRCVNGGDRGSLSRADYSFAAFRADPQRANLPVCGACGSLLRPHVLWFDESYTGHRDYQIDRVLRAAKHANLVLFIGTSFSVGVTDYVLRTALSKSIPLISVDPSGRSPHRRVSVLAAAAEQALPAVVAALHRG